MRHALHTRAESLIETVIAITVIVLATTAGMSLIRTALVGNEVIGEKIVALNLAVEGVEAMRNLRDSNYLKFATDPDNCWDAFFAETIVDCPYDKVENNHSYSFTRDFAGVPALSWGLTEIDPDNPDEGWLDLYAVASGGETLYMYLPSGNPNPLLSVEESRPFRRYVTTQYSGGPSPDLLITVTVEWDVKGVTKSVELQERLNNIL